MSLQRSVTSRGRRASRYAAAVAAIWVLLWAGAALGADADGPHSTWYAAAGGEGWVGGPTGGHGVLLAHWRWRSDASDLGFDAQYNTDTLRFEATFDVPGGGLSGFVRASGQYPVARLLTDYYRRGERVPGREFLAGYGSVTSGLRYRTGAHHFDLEGTGRRWFFDRADRTADALELPPEAWAFEPTLHYTLWRVEPDSSQWEPHQLFRRIRGAALGLSVGAEFRSTARPWGARGDAFREPDPRNAPGRSVLTFRHWAASGASLGDRFRVQFGEQVRWGVGEDDLSRDRLGGLSPYSVRLGGLPWGALVSGRYLAGHLDLRLRVPSDHEIGAFVDGAAVADPRRLGNQTDFGPFGGVGLLADLRFGAWKFDGRVGTALSAGRFIQRPVVDVWLSGGRRW